MASTDRKSGGIKAIILRRSGTGNPKKQKQPKPVASQMTFFEHLGELRNRLMWSSLAVAICTGIAWYFSRDILQAFLDLANPAIAAVVAKGFVAPEFVTTDIVGSFQVYFDLALQTGLLLASPILVYHILAFMAPALEPETQPGETGYAEEVKMLRSIRRSLVLFVPFVAVFFLVGIAFAYYMVLPSAVKFLLGFGEGQFRALPNVKSYVGTMAKVMFWSGLVFEVPIFMFLLAKMKIVTWRKLARFWKWALVLSLVAAAFITPSPEIFSQAIIAIPVYGLFWLGVLFARFA